MSLEQLTSQLSKSFVANKYAECLKLLPQIKLLLIEQNLLVPSLTTAANPSDLAITRSILEIGALASINSEDLNGFSSYITLLKPFYDLTNLPDSPNKNKLLSLYLLLLLTQGDLALFHIELERLSNFGLSVDELEKDQYFAIPIKFEKWIIDGDFYKVYELLSSKHSFPCKEFNLFEKELLDSIRLTIATNIESSYTTLPLENLKLLLFLKNLDDVKSYIDQMGWFVDNGEVHFDKRSSAIEDEINDEKQILKNALTYAKEMESIV
ncbi:hypothetical protein KL905_002911 [Ogataea polymorpha]|uniref:Uncharacterized protein n=1 Tax=Ogataea polymorpha TaxID=460523 RepID=A0A1B7SQM7_9ASCO|nr:uncharacterized protein OGAPODRAFT_92228 [Ogataea polymorpha]KAG7880242.1 hypothetical protein KL937_002469 [Ogataea polymorpha]KAG7888891.1 hypothetical protein KL936_003278 [Ogataea polymorpha]KAG7893332.1 hypothetical protein KL908_003065 [Ogataea polymorpha]KAG7900769.1 hypothetical protein KL935_002702 [Ogataea polymorpha]KAG7916546.1 hypothetical protein KL927_003185 [Ogataea polymorpha]